MPWRRVALGSSGRTAALTFIDILKAKIPELFPLRYSGILALGGLYVSRHFRSNGCKVENKSKIGKNEVLFFRFILCSLSVHEKEKITYYRAIFY